MTIHARLVVASLLLTFRASAAPLWQPLQEPGTNGWVAGFEVSPFDSNTLAASGDMFGAAFSSTAGTHWVPATGFQAWEMGAFTWHPTNPNIVWVGTRGGPYQSQDGGKNFSLRRSGMPAISSTAFTAQVQQILYDPNDANTLLALGGIHRYGADTIGGAGQVWRSSDGGATWSLRGTIGAVNIVRGGFAAGSSSVVYAATTGGLFKSTDSGATWSNTTSALPTAVSLALHPTDPNTLWVTTKNARVYKTTNGAASWALSSTGLPSYATNDPGYIVVSKTNPNRLYCSQPTAPYSTGFFRSDDGGATWTDMLDPTTIGSKLLGGNAYFLPFGSTYDQATWLAVDPHDPDIAYQAAPGFIVRTTNGGVTWTDITSHPAGGGRFRGNGFQGEAATKIAFNPFRPGQLFGLGMDCSKVTHSDDFGWSWVAGAPAPINMWNGAQDATFAQDGTIYIGTGQNGNSINEAMIKSTNGGASWVYLPRPSGASGTNAAVYTLPTDSATVWAGIGSVVYRSTDGGSSWTAVTGSLGYAIFNFAVDPVTPTTFYVGAASGVYKTTDGTHFALMAGSPTSTAGNYVTTDPQDSNIVYVATLNPPNGGVWKSVGGTWSRIWNKSMTGGLAVDPRDNQHLAVITMDWPTHDLAFADGVWVSSDGGQAWTQASLGLQNLAGTTIAFNPDGSGQVVVGVAGGGFAVTDLGVSTPYKGAVHALPGRLEAEDYDACGEGCAYHRALAGAVNAISYRADDVGVCAGGSGAAVCNAGPGEWLKYQVQANDGVHDLSVSAAATVAGSTFHLELNGVNVSGPITVPNNGATSFAALSIPGVFVSAGTQHLKLRIDSGRVSIDAIDVGPDTGGVGGGGTGGDGGTSTTSADGGTDTADIGPGADSADGGSDENGTPNRLHGGCSQVGQRRDAPSAPLPLGVFGLCGVTLALGRRRARRRDAR